MDKGISVIARGIEKLSQGQPPEPISLCPGIDLFRVSLAGDALEMHHAPLPHILQIHFCISGQAEWTMGGGGKLYLNPGNFSIHSMGHCAHSKIAFSTQPYEGLLLSVDTEQLSAHPPELLSGAEDLGTALREKYCQADGPVFLTGTPETDRIFQSLCQPRERWALLWLRLKAMELLLSLASREVPAQNKLEAFSPEQIEIVRSIHDSLLQHMEQRITIQELSRQYLIDPTTLKAAFKSVYGTSLAAHIREHKMEQAAKLLQTTNLSIAEIAQSVGYDSQSKFTEAFKAAYHMLPREYRKNPGCGPDSLPCE